MPSSVHRTSQPARAESFFRPTLEKSRSWPRLFDGTASTSPPRPAPRSRSMTTHQPTRRRHGGVRLRQDDRGCSARPAAAGAVRRRRRLPSPGEHRQDGRRRAARRRRPRPVAAHHRRLAGRAHRDRWSGQLLGPASGPTATSCVGTPRTPSSSTCTATATCIAARVRPAAPGTSCPPPSSTRQFATLEPLEPDENGAVLDVAQPVDALVEQSLDRPRPERCIARMTTDLSRSCSPPLGRPTAAGHPGVHASCRPRCSASPSSSCSSRSSSCTRSSA